MNKYKRRAGLLVLSMLLVMAYPMAVFASPATTVSIPDDASADYCDEVTVEINITDVIDMGGVDIWLSYDSSVVEVTDVTDGDLGAITSNILNGVTKMNWYGTPGETGDFVFANVTLHAVGNPGDTSPLDLEVQELVDSGTIGISHDVDDGLFTVTGVPAPAPAVGGTAYLPNKAGMLAPWIVLGVTLAIVISWVARKRRRARV